LCFWGFLFAGSMMRRGRGCPTTVRARARLRLDLDDGRIDSWTICSGLWVQFSEVMLCACCSLPHGQNQVRHNAHLVIGAAQNSPECGYRGLFNWVARLARLAGHLDDSRCAHLAVAVDVSLNKGEYRWASVLILALANSFEAIKQTAGSRTLVPD
jgi:hypothetical protein